MDKKGISTLVIVAIIVIAVVVGGIAVYVWYSGGGDGGVTPTPTPAPTPDIEGATSLQFDVIATIEGVTEEYTFMAKNIGTSELMLRVDQTDAQGNEFKYILNQAEEKVLVYYEGAWTDLSDTFATYWDTWNPALDDYKTNLENWAGTGDYEYTSGANSYKISNIVVNPTLADSLFEAG